MINKKDIKNQIESDFGNNALEVFKLFDEAFARAEYLNNARIIRCILFLANKDIEKLKKNIEAATYDPRDVILWAEYIKPEHEENLKRIRDFNKPFDQAGTNVKE